MSNTTTSSTVCPQKEKPAQSKRRTEHPCNVALLLCSTMSLLPRALSNLATSLPGLARGMAAQGQRTQETQESLQQQPAGGCPRGFPGSPGIQQSQFLTAPLLNKLLLEPGRSLGKPIYYFYYCLGKSIPALSNIRKVLRVHMEETDPGISKFSSFGLLYILNNLFGVSVSCVICYQ